MISALALIEVYAVVVRGTMNAVIITIMAVVKIAAVGLERL